MQKDKGDIFLSQNIKDHVDKDSGYFLELWSILDEMSKDKLKPLSCDYLNPEERAKDNLNSFINRNPHVILQYPSSRGRIYVETISEKRQSPLLFLKIPYLYTHIYIYTAPEYEHGKEETKIYSLKEISLSERKE